MKKAISPAATVAIIVAALVLVGLIGWKLVGQSPAGPGEEVTKLTREDMAKQRAAGPPEGPPLPTAKGRPGQPPSGL